MFEREREGGDDGKGEKAKKAKKRELEIRESETLVSVCAFM